MKSPQIHRVTLTPEHRATAGGLPHQVDHLATDVVRSDAWVVLVAETDAAGPDAPRHLRHGRAVAVFPAAGVEAIDLVDAATPGLPLTQPPA